MLKKGKYSQIQAFGMEFCLLQKILVNLEFTLHVHGRLGRHNRVRPNPSIMPGCVVGLVELVQRKTVQRSPLQETIVFEI